MAERYTREDVARILESVNEAARRLRLRGAGAWAVETMGGTYLYLTDRSYRDSEGRTGPGEKIEDLGATYHRAYLRLFDLRRDLLTVQLRQDDDDSAGVFEDLETGQRAYISRDPGGRRLYRLTWSNGVEFGDGFETVQDVHEAFARRND